MLSDLARVFSSNGVVLPGTEYVPSGSGKPPAPVSGPGSFQSHFDQASARLELSPRAVRQAEASSRGGDSGEDLGKEEEAEVEKLKERDVEVRTHEQQH